MPAWQMGGEGRPRLGSQGGGAALPACARCPMRIVAPWAAVLGTAVVSGVCVAVWSACVASTGGVYCSAE